MMSRLLCSLWLLALFSCVEDPPVPVTGEAAIRSQFIPADSINKLEVRQGLNNKLITEVDQEIDRIESLIEAGEPGDFTSELVFLTTTLDSLREINSSLNSSIRELSRGTIRLDFLTAIGAEEEITYAFPQDIYGLPLTRNANEVTFVIGYGSYLEEATVTYQLETLFEDQVVRNRGFSLELAAITFDSVHVQCPADTCNTDEILYTFYF
jgi:hypothetical protein